MCMVYTSHPVGSETTSSTSLFVEPVPRGQLELMCSLCALCVGSGPVKTGAVGSAQFAFIGQLCHIVAPVGGITGSFSSQRPVAQYHYGHFPQSMACGLVPCWERMAKTMGSQWFNVDPNSLLAFVCFFMGLVTVWKVAVAQR